MQHFSGAKKTNKQKKKDQRNKEIRKWCRAELSRGRFSEPILGCIWASPLKTLAEMDFQRQPRVLRLFNRQKLRNNPQK